MSGPSPFYRLSTRAILSCVFKFLMCVNFDPEVLGIYPREISQLCRGIYMDIYHSTVYSPKVCETTEMSFHVGPDEINEGTVILVNTMQLVKWRY